MHLNGVITLGSAVSISAGIDSQYPDMIGRRRRHDRIKTQYHDRIESRHQYGIKNSCHQRFECRHHHGIGNRRCDDIENRRCDGIVNRSRDGIENRRRDSIETWHRNSIENRQHGDIENRHLHRNDSTSNSAKCPDQRDTRLDSNQQCK